ncbi:MarR family transcriptional regulator [Desulfoluna sp.]|uniref:MarR family winged helix-turn-helix transcriptional regulator n=1 Tax=Desulfoluna sp. TaxID=2045199 RepID=UPI002626CD77|nr:MarR family transcriptional regulator [Desulfoluna sp.]
MQKNLMELIDTVNSRHAKGVDFGTGHRLFPAEIHTLTAIERDEGLTMTQLAHALTVSKPTVSERIRKLTTHGLITREKGPTDAKSVLLRLTDAGHIACQGHKALHEEMYDRFEAHFAEEAPEKIKQFTDTFTQLLTLAKSFDSHRT